MDMVISWFAKLLIKGHDLLVRVLFFFLRPFFLYLVTPVFYNAFSIETE